MADPYDTLGVSKNCTRQELKQAFRARARIVHPDRGGEPAAFIQLRQAYDQIKTELRRRRTGPIAGSAGRPAQPDPRPPLPEPSWQPDLILLDLEPTRTRPPRPPDPNWEPDLILMDDDPRRGRLPEAPDPNWEPDLILFDDEPRDGRFPEPRDPRVARQNYFGWLTRVSERSEGEVPLSHETWFRVLGMVVLFAVIALSIWMCWTVWSHDGRTDTSLGPAEHSRPSQ